MWSLSACEINAAETIVISIACYVSNCNEPIGQSMTAVISAECTIEQLPWPTSRRTSLFMRRSDLGVALIHLHCESIVHFHRRRLYSHHLKGTSLGQLSHEVLWLYILSESERRDLAA